MSQKRNTQDPSPDPFSESTLAQIFPYRCLEEKIYIQNSESDQIEFKKSFSLGAMDLYAKNIAAFANRDGGYLVFGVEDITKEVVGINIQKFDSIDPAKFTQSVRQNLAPEITWKIGRLQIQSFTIGLIFIYPAIQKPVVCLRTTQEISEGAIFYRYPGSSEKIRYSELRDLIDERCMQERISWLRLFERIARIGPENVGILNTNTGEISGKHASFHISEDLLPKIRFINSGTFVESGGDPTLRLVGDVVSTKIINNREIVRERIHGKEILTKFLLQENVDTPVDYLKAICYEPTVYYPIYFFVGLSQLKFEDIITEISNVDYRPQNTKNALIRRLRSRDDKLKKGGSLEAKSDQALRRAELLTSLKKKSISDSQVFDNMRPLLEVLTHLQKGDVELNDVCQLLLRTVLPLYSSLGPGDAYWLRQAICHLDMEWYKVHVSMNAK